MSRFSLIRAGFWMLAALLAETTLLPQWVAVRWIPQISFLVLLFTSLRGGMRVGLALGLLLGIFQSLFTALPGERVIWIYAGLGAAAGAAKNLIFIESPLAQWFAPIGFGLLTEFVFFWMMPWDDTPLGFGEFIRMIRASNLPITCVLSGFVYAACDRRLFSRKNK